MINPVPQSKVLLRLSLYDCTYCDPPKSRDKVFNRDNAFEMAHAIEWISNCMVLAPNDMPKLEKMLRFNLPEKSTYREALHWTEDHWYQF